jgi:hypothetical protein
VIATLVGEVTGDPTALRKGSVDRVEGGGEFIEVVNFEPADGIVKEERSIVLRVIDRAALEEHGTWSIGDEAPAGGD